MSKVLDTNHDFSIRSPQPVHSGKVRSVYWLGDADSRRLIEGRGYPVPLDAELAVMIVSDRLSAFDCIWQGEQQLNGVPGKGAALNAVSQYWFEQFAAAGLARSHILESPHPLVWIVQRAQPVRIEAIARRYLTGSMWRSYAAGERSFCGVELPDHLMKDQRLTELLITPSSKGILRGLQGIPEVDDVNVSRADLQRHWQALGFQRVEDIDHYERLLSEGFELIADRLAALEQIFVDTKFEFGYAKNAQGITELIYMDEVGTPDSSRMWDAAAYADGVVRENSKEGFRQALLDWVPDPELLLDKARMAERLDFAAAARLPPEMLLNVAETYRAVASAIVGASVPVVEHPREEINDLLSAELGLL